MLKWIMGLGFPAVPAGRTTRGRFGEATGNQLRRAMPVPVNRSERGFLSFSGIFALVVLAAMIFLGIKLLPPFIMNYQLQSAVESIARRATYSPMTEADIRKALMQEANEAGVPLDDRQVFVQKGRGTVDIRVQYSVPVDLLVRQVELSFSPSAGNRNITSR